jgi:subtilisin
MLKKTLFLFAVGCIVLASCKKENNASDETEDPCVEQLSARNGEIIPGQYIIGLKSSTDTRSITQSRLRDLVRSIASRNRVNDNAVLVSFAGEPGGFVARLSPGQAASLRSDASVGIVEPDRIIALATCFEVVEPRLITWNINKVGYGDGRGKTAWIIDSGVDLDHPDLNVDVTRSRSFISGSSSPDDGNGHGTHVAGVIGARNNSFGMLGVASDASIVALKVLNDEGVGSVSSIIQALSYVNTNARPGDVVNMSLGDDEGISEVLDQQVTNTANKGIFFAIAAGNDGVPASRYSPARVNGANIFTVSAVDSLNRFANFSNYGNDVVDFAAPGVRIASTYSNGRYAILSGTSMAAPHVAGLLLLNGRNIKSSGTAINDPDGEPDKIAHK